MYKAELAIWRMRWALVVCLLCSGPPACAAFPDQSGGPQQQAERPQVETTQDFNLQLERLRLQLGEQGAAASAREYRIGPEDLVEISVFEAPEMNRALRVSASGEISFPLLGAVRASGLTARELEAVLQELLQRSYLKEPHVSVFVREMESHPVSVVGAVKKPGVFQVRGVKTVLEMLSMAEGLADDAGDTVYVMRGANLRWVAGSGESGRESPAALVAGERSRTGASAETLPAREASVEVNLKGLLESSDPRDNVPIFPGDIVTVTRAGIVYVVGEVRRPGGFVLRTNENISVLQAIALAEGLTRTAAKSHGRIIRTDPRTGIRTEIPVDLNKVLASKAPDVMLQPRDIVFVPNSAARGAMYRGAEAAISIVSGLLVFRR